VAITDISDHLGTLLLISELKPKIKDTNKTCFIIRNMKNFKLETSLNDLNDTLTQLKFESDLSHPTSNVKIL